MKRLGLALLTFGLIGVAVAGCGDKGTMMNPDGGNGLGDMFVTTGCTTVDDCSPTPCQTAKCNPVTKQCTYTDKVCTADSECTAGMCDATTGDCKQNPANEGMACTTTSSEPGTCGSGTCNGTPSCASSFPETVYCDGRSQYSFKVGSNDPAAFGGGQAIISSYACAPNAAGPEVAFIIGTKSGLTADEDITVSIRLTDSMGVTAADQTTVDLDLIILEDTCTQGATCMNPAAGAGFKGVTAGTSAERVTFTAKPGKTYYAVVDGKDMNQAHDFAIEVEACGRCQPTDTTRLSCNVSTPVMLNSSTMNGAAKVDSWMCNAMAVPAAGKEIPFLYTMPDNLARNVTAKITGANPDVKLLAMRQSFWGECVGDDPDASSSSFCDSKTSTGGNATLQFTTDSDGSDFARYWVVVDATSTTDSNFGLELDCSKACGTTSDALSCGGTTDTKKVSGTTIGGRAEISYWGPNATGCDLLTGLNGPEIVVPFTADVPGGGTYKIDLVSKTAGKNLALTILDAGTAMGPACDPALTCMVNTPVVDAGHSGTHTTQGNTKPAAVTFTASFMHTYFIVVDGVDAAGGDFDLYAAGTASGIGCQ